MVVPPPTARGDDVDILHGVSVPDPYRWLEDTDDALVRAWVGAQNTRTAEVLAARPERNAWRARIAALMAHPLVSEVQLRGEVAVLIERAAGADQSVLTARRLGAADGAGEPLVLVDPAAAGDATAAIDWYEVSPDGALVAYGTSTGGTERSTLRVVATGPTDDVAAEHHEEAIGDTRACSVAWEPDASGFFYTRYPPGEEYGRTVRYHRLGDDAAGDDEVWADLPTPEAWPDVTLSPSGRWLAVHVSVGWSQTDVHLLDRRSDRWSTPVAGVEAESRFAFGPDERSLVGTTTLEASSGRLVVVPLPEADDVTQPSSWRTIVAERDAVLGSPTIVGDEVWTTVSDGGVDGVERRAIDGELLGSLGEAALGVASVIGLSGDRGTGAALVVVDSFERPPAVWRANAGSDSAQPWWTPSDRDEIDTGTDADCDGDARLTVRHVSYLSADGTEVGLFLVHRADVVPDASTPALLTGYGGFAIAMTPGWSPQLAAWCDAGGLYAVAQLRGGLEHGEDWHRAGKREHKQHVFDDFAAAADWLCGEQFTARARLAIVGRSNGGLLVGAALTQRPDLCAAVWCGVPLLDMVRFPQFLIARLWTEEYGDPGVAEELSWLHAYSPYHHVGDGTCYPAVLLTCAEGDSRVHPCHARKMAAALQHASACADARPILLTEERDAGHGVGKPVHLRAAELADAVTFLAWQLGWEAFSPADRPH